MRQWHIFWVIALGLLSVSLTKVYAQAQKEWRATEEGTTTKIKVNTDYAGTKPGSGNNLPRVEELKSKSGIWVTWPGFTMMPDGSSRLFIQTTVKVKYKLVKKNKQIQIKLKNAKVYLSNNRNPLVTTHFNTPLNRAYLKKQRKKSVDLIMKLRKKTSPKISQTVDSDGFYYLFIDFPKGDYKVEKTEETSSGNLSFSGHGTREETTNAKGTPDTSEDTTTQPETESAP